MTKIHSFLALAAMTILTVFSARADWTATLEWEHPGSLEIYAGGLSASYKVNVPASATSMDVHVDGSTAIYVAPAEGYVVTGAQCQDDGSNLRVLNFSTIGKRGVSISSYDHNGHTVKVDCVPLVMDGEIEINVINGRQQLQCQFVETGRAITLHTGAQKVAFSKEYETDIEFTATAAFASDPYIIYNGEKQEWSGMFGILSSTFSVSDGDTFEIKYCDTEDAPEAPEVHVAIEYANDMARQALIMLYNITQAKTIGVGNSFDAKEGDKVRFVFNTKEYDVEVNGVKLNPSDGDSTPYVMTFDTDQTVTISAAVRQWGETTVTVGVKSLEGLQMRRGTIDGELIDLSTLTASGTENFRFKCIEPAQSVKVTKYDIPVSLKDPKVFVSAYGDCWIEVAETVVDGEHIPSGVAMPGSPLYVLNSQIVRDTRLVVFVGTDGIQAKGSDMAIRDHNRNVYELKEGYNEFMIDPAYSSPFTVLYFGSGSPSISAYYEGLMCSLDDNEAPFFNVTSDAVAHIFAGKNAAACTISATFEEGADDSTEIVVDRMHKITKENPRVSTFRTCEVSVTPGNNKYLLDGEEAEYEGETHTFKARQSHQITISEGEKPQQPEIEYGVNVSSYPNGVMYAEFIFAESLKIELVEEATAFIYDAEGEEVQRVIYDEELQNMLAWNGQLIIDFVKPTFKGQYKLVLPADDFSIIDTLSSLYVPHQDFEVEFTVEQDDPATPAEVEYTATVGTYPNEVMYAEFTLAESLRVDLEEGTTAYIKNAEGEVVDTIVYNEDLQNMLGWNGLLIVDFAKPEQAGDYTLVVPAGSFTIYDTLASAVVLHEDFVAEFTIEATSGIEAIISGNVNVTVYSIDGRMVLSNAKAEQLRSLSTGIYIINGVKYLKH